MFGPYEGDYDTDEQYQAVLIAYNEAMDKRRQRILKERQTKEQEAQAKQKRILLRQSSQGRFQIRIEDFIATYHTFPKTRHAFWWLFHNLVAHIAIGLIPCKWSFVLHDWTSDRLNLKNTKEG